MNTLSSTALLYSAHVFPPLCPPLSLSMFLSPTSHSILLGLIIFFCHSSSSIRLSSHPHFHTSSVPSPAPSSSTLSCPRLFTSLTLITPLRSSLRLCVRGGQIHEANVRGIAISCFLLMSVISGLLNWSIVVWLSYNLEIAKCNKLSSREKTNAEYCIHICNKVIQGK